MGYKVAIVGVTGNVGREMMNVLSERKFPVDELYALASRRSVAWQPGAESNKYSGDTRSISAGGWFWMIWSRPARS